MNKSFSIIDQLLIYEHMTVWSSILFWSCSKIDDQRFQFFSSIRAFDVNFLIIQWIEYLQISFNLFSSLTSHAVNNHDMNSSIKIKISIVVNARHWINSHIQQNLNKSLDFRESDVFSRSDMIEDFCLLQIDLILVFSIMISRSEEQKNNWNNKNEIWDLRRRLSWDMKSLCEIWIKM
jgi:hypothetical protein